jgi:hypothetical protein
MSTSAGPGANGATELYRLHVRPAGNPQDTFRYCLEEGVLGTGWGTTAWGKPNERPATWDDYLRLARAIWLERKFAPVRWFHDAKEGALVWTRDPHGIYYLAQLVGGWEYRDEDVNRQLDLNNVRPVEIFPIAHADAAVPGAVVRSFSGRGQAFRRVHSAAATAYSHRLFAQLAGKPRVAWTPTPHEILDSLLDPFDVEDLVAAYLQVELGLVALPTRGDRSKLAYEYTLRDPHSGQVFAVQVKTGDAEVPVGELSDAAGLKWMIFSARKRYHAPLPPHVSAIDPEAVINFMERRSNALPPVVSRWLTFVHSA